MTKILAYKSIYQNSIDKMMLEIADEFDIPIFSQSSTQTNKIVDQYWIALNNNIVVGTIGLIELSNGNVILKKLFLKKKYRGEENGISKLLLEKVINWCTDKNIKSIYLGTMKQFDRAQKFYVKNNFKQISKNNLPNDFIDNSIDDFYYKLSL